MRNDVHINQLFPKHLFWDVDMACLDIDKDRDLIIPRALIATTPLTFTADIAKLETLYSKAAIARELRATKEKVSDKVCHLVARRYHVKQFSRFLTRTEKCALYLSAGHEKRLPASLNRHSRQVGIAAVYHWPNR